MDKNDTSTWNEWGRYVLKELEKLNGSYDQIKEQLTEVKSGMNDMRNLTKEMGELQVWKKEVNDVIIPNKLEIAELKEWKKEISDTITPKQLAETKSDVEKLKTFKTQAITVWLVVQVLTGLFFAIFGLLKK
jgi:predicted nuclease with TOPRIM domain